MFFKILFYNQHYSVESYKLKEGQKMAKKLSKVFGDKNIKLVKAKEFWEALEK